MIILRISLCNERSTMRIRTVATAQLYEHDLKRDTQAKPASRQLWRRTLHASHPGRCGAHVMETELASFVHGQLRYENEKAERTFDQKQWQRNRLTCAVDSQTSRQRSSSARYGSRILHLGCVRHRYRPNRKRLIPCERETCFAQGSLLFGHQRFALFNPHLVCSRSDEAPSESFLSHIFSGLHLRKNSINGRPGLS